LGIVERTRPGDVAESDAQGADGSDAITRMALRLGVPEREVTPRVRMAVAALTGEIDRLRREADGARKKLLEAESAANQDTLLPILNRRAFVREIARFIAFVERYGTPASLLYLDLDGFKAVNDTHGHAAGDAVLHHFAALLAAHVRGTDVAVVLAHASLEQARIKGESLCRALNNNPLRWQGKPVAVSCSYGTHELRAGENADAAMASADLAMYAHKRERV
jgi:diguanylate cyclase (GGDEF)-like protein